MDFFDLRARARLVLAEVLARSGQHDELRRVAADVMRIYDAKGDVTGGGWAQRRLDQLGVELR
jgi:hypothetical protein